MGLHFISYSGVDAKDFAVRLADELATGPPAICVWLDKRELKPGLDWDEQIGEAIKTCHSLLFVMSRDSVTPNSVCKKEWTQALKYRKPVIPLRFHRDAELPFRLEPREYIDFSGGFESALARLRNHLQWLSGPGGALQALKDRLADAKRDLSRVADQDRPQILSEIADLEEQIARQQRLVDHPQAMPERVHKSAAPSANREPQPTAHYTLRMFKGNEQVGTSTVAIVPGGHSYPKVDQTIDDKWRVTKVLVDRPEGEYWIRVEPLARRTSDTKSWDPAVLERASRDLAVYVGPMANVIVRRASQLTPSLGQLYQALAAEIASPTDRQKFLASHRF
ncbi:MAG: TIR domain-containing protein [Terriglobia bacterium]